MQDLTVIGGGLAGSEAAWQAAKQGVHVNLYEMRPKKNTAAHVTGDLAEIICSNSLGSNLINRASGLLKEELRRLGSLLLECAEATALPAGGALAVDRAAFSSLVTDRISTHPLITLHRQEMTGIPAGPVIIATGPLTSTLMAESIQRLTGQDNLFFYDAISPTITHESINMEIAYRGTRFRIEEKDEGDYINCPFDSEGYGNFVDALSGAQCIALREFEQEIRMGVKAGRREFFEGCLPIEVMAERGKESLAFGPMRPIGLMNPHTQKRPFAVVQLRQDNQANTSYNLVGFQTNLTYLEQKRVFRMIPGLENADFVRYGQMHRNTFIASPVILHPTLQNKSREDLFFAGQITGVEGYMGNIATGLLAGWNASRFLAGKSLVELPIETMLGGLCRYITQSELKNFQPMKANFGILPPLPQAPRIKPERAMLYSERAQQALDQFLKGLNW